MTAAEGLCDDRVECARCAVTMGVGRGDDDAVSEGNSWLGASNAVREGDQSAHRCVAVPMTSWMSTAFPAADALGATTRGRLAAAASSGLCSSHVRATHAGTALTRGAASWWPAHARQAITQPHAHHLCRPAQPCSGWRDVMRPPSSHAGGAQWSASPKTKNQPFVPAPVSRGKTSIILMYKQFSYECASC